MTQTIKKEYCNCDEPCFNENVHEAQFCCNCQNTVQTNSSGDKKNG